MKAWRLRFHLALAFVGVTGVALILALALASPGSGGVSAVATCSTTLAEAASAGASRIVVANPTGCDMGEKIVLNQGESNGECQEIERVAVGAPMLYLVDTLVYDHSQGETVVEVTVCPTATATPTPTPTPTPAPAVSPTPTPTPAYMMYNCPQAGKWSIASWAAIATWDGGADGVDSNGVDIGEALATCGEGVVDAAYALDPDTQGWLRHFPGHPELSTKPTVKDNEGLIVHGALAPMPVARPIAFASDRDGNFEIYVMNADGTGQTRLTNSLGVDRDPAWSPDGSKIAFTSDRDGNSEIYVMNADGTGQARRTNNAAEDGEPAWSPDGSKIAFTSDRDGNANIYVMNAGGTGQTRRTNNAAEDGEPAWSPDGTKIAFASNRDGDREIYVVNADGKGQTRLTNSPRDDFAPAWSPGGSKIAFQTNRDWNYEIYVMNADGTGQTNLTNNSVSDGVPAWSPGGSQIAFHSDRDWNYEIYVMNADGTGQTNLTNNPGQSWVTALQDWEPAWAPPTPTASAAGQMYGCPQAGKWAIATWARGNAVDAGEALDGVDIGEALATCGEEVGAVYALDPDSQMWLRHFPGHPEFSNKATVQANEGLILHGMATAVARRIAFASDRDGDFEIYRMNADGSGQTNLTNHSGQDYEPAWSPDGTKIAFVSSRDGNYEIYVMNADGTGQTRLTNNGVGD